MNRRQLGGVFSGLAMLLLMLSSAGLAGCGMLETDTVFSPAGTTTVVYLVRHAERDEGLDPPLNDEGMIRAQSLVEELAEVDVTAVFYPDLLRNRQTAQPLVDRDNPTVRVFGALEAGDTKALANTFVDEVVRDHAGGVVLWIGNTGPVTGSQSGNLQEIYARFGGTDSPPIRYRDIYQVVLTEDQPPQITVGQYGGPSSLD